MRCADGEQNPLSDEAPPREVTLVSQAREGDHGAFMHLAGAHRHRLYALTRRFAGSVEDAEDLTQEVLVRAFRYFAKFRSDGDFGAWIMKIAVNTCLTHRSRKRAATDGVQTFQSLRPSPSPTDQPHASLEAQTQSAQIHVAISALPKRQRMAIVLCEMDGHTAGEAAAMMGCRPGTVKQHLHRARRALAVRLAGLLDNGQEEETP